jgi:phage antirepressor YoqD-like protein
MKELVFKSDKSTPVTTMSSREIAELTGKQHKHVLVDCDKLNENYSELGLAEISAGVYTHPNTGSQQHREYLLTKIQCFDLMTGYDTKLRIKVNRRWEELESANQIDFSDPDTVLMLAQNWKQERQKRLEAETKVQEQAPKVLFADAVATSERSVLISELAKILQQNGINIGQNRLFEWLRNNGYLCSKGEYYNQPSQRAMDMGIFRIKKNVINKPDGTTLLTSTTTVTGKGQIYFTNKFINNKNLQLELIH